MSFSNYLENALLDHELMNSAYTQPSNLYVALSTSDPTDDGSGMTGEPVGNNYSRVSTAAADWNAASAGSADNANDVSFPQASGAWGTIAYFGLFDQVITSYAVGGVDTGADTITVSGQDVTSEFAAGTLCRIESSTGNDGVYEVSSSTFSTDTTITVSGDLTDSTADGNIQALGHLHGSGAVSSSKSVTSGDTPVFSAGDLTVTLD